MGNKGEVVLGIKKKLEESLPQNVFEPLRRVYVDFCYVVMHFVPKVWYLKWQFKKKMGYPLNMNYPRTFNEKLQWLKLHDHNPLYIKMVDKYEVKKYVANLIGEEYIIPTLGVWDCYNEIDFDNLPNQFILKCTHDSGSVVVCTEKNRFDIKEAEKKIEDGLRYNYYYRGGFEWPYKNVRPRIIAEKYIGYYPIDYKFYVFNGEIDSIMTCVGREFGHPKFIFYTEKWERKYYQHEWIEPSINVEKPQNLDLMIRLVHKLAKGFVHVRIDLYNIDGKIYFGEYTLYNQSGFDVDINYKTDALWGSKIILHD